MRKYIDNSKPNVNPESEEKGQKAGESKDKLTMYNKIDTRSPQRWMIETD